MRYPDFYTPDEIQLMKKALQCIEVLCESNCLDSSIPVTEHPADCKWCAIYQIAHAGGSPSCRNSHVSWEEDLNKLHDKVSEALL